MSFVVSIVFVVVAYHLASDLGEKFESRSLFLKAKEIANYVNREGIALDSSMEMKSFDSIFKEFGDDLIGFEIWNSDIHKVIKPTNQKIKPPELLLAVQNNVTKQGFVDGHENRIMWIYFSAPSSKTSVMLLVRAYALDMALSYVANRLFVTSFLTTWLAIWAALILSAIIAKQFEKNNEQLAHLANHDPLTGLPNRNFFYAHFKEFESRVRFKNRRGVSVRGTLLMIDLDKFKDINDSLGHNVGDEILVKLSQRLSKYLEKSEDTFVRYGGDEFVVWSEKKENLDSISLAKKILELCRKPIRIGKSFFEVGASIGLASYPDDGGCLDELVRNADVAMYRAKNLRLGYQVYQASRDKYSDLRIQLRGQLSSALADAQFVLHYQPKVRLPKEEIMGVECLVRWEHPQQGLLLPNNFIDLVEQSSLIHEFTRYIIERAIFQCKCWIDKGFPLCVAVNISHYNLNDPELVPFIKSRLVYYQVPAKYLEIELTESVTMVEISSVHSVFKKLNEIGVRISIDDFGTGISSLAYLKDLQVDYVKIDRSFIANLLCDESDEAMIKSILYLGENLNKTVVAEGVESKEQSLRLIELGCRFAQGYYYGKPLDIDSFNIAMGICDRSVLSS